MRNRTFNYLEKQSAIPCPAGSRKKDVHALVRDGNNMRLRKTGEIDVVEQIQSHHDGVSLAKMIERFKRGDSTALNRGGAFYEDVSGYETDPSLVINNTRAATAAAAQQSQAAADPIPADPTPADPTNDGGVNNVQSE